MTKTSSSNGLRNADLLVTEQIATFIREIWRMAKNMTNPRKKGKISLEQYWILRLIYNSGPLRIKDIAFEIGTASSPVTISVKKLEHSRLLRRERSRTDERVVTVHLTPLGRKVFEAGRQERRRALSSLFNSLDELERVQLRDLLSKTLAHTKEKQAERVLYNSRNKVG